MFKGQQKIYLGCPYSHSYPAIREFRFKRVSRMALKLIKEGHLVYSPITSSHPLCELDEDLPTDFNYWRELDISFIKWSDILVVLKLRDWEKSQGLKEEIEIAKSLGKEIVYIDYEV